MGRFLDRIRAGREIRKTLKKEVKRLKDLETSDFGASDKPLWYQKAKPYWGVSEGVLVNIKTLWPGEKDDKVIDEIITIGDEIFSPNENVSVQAEKDFLEKIKPHIPMMVLVLGSMKIFTGKKIDKILDEIIFVLNVIKEEPLVH